MRINAKDKNVASCNAGRQSGNALIYVLIAIVLFAALNFTFSRNTDSSETSLLTEGQVEMLAGQMIAYAAQVESGINQMTFSGVNEGNLDFILPGAAGFDEAAAADNVNKVFHPQGGGLTPAQLDPKAIGDTAAGVDAGWYLGMFSNVEWTKSADNDTILAAYQISQPICSKINEKIKGDPAIPAIVGGTNLFNLFVDPAVHGMGTAANLTSATCPDCADYISLCVSRSNTYVFYTVVLPR